MATKHFLQRHGLAASLLSAMLAISGCGGDSSSSTPDPLPPEPPPPTTCTIPTGPSPIVLSAATAPATFAALDIKVTVCTVAIAGKPVVNFSLTDASGNAVIGYGSKSQSATATVPSYPNLSFALAKLMPTSNGEPNYWVSYIVSTVPTKNASTGAITASVPTRPTSDSTGTLVDNGTAPTSTPSIAT